MACVTCKNKGICAGMWNKIYGHHDTVNNFHWEIWYCDGVYILQLGGKTNEM